MTGCHPVTNLSCEPWHRRLLDLMNTVKSGGRPGVQCREGLLDGERVVILGLADDGYEPVCVVLDDALASRLEFGGPEPGESATGGRR